MSGAPTESAFQLLYYRHMQYFLLSHHFRNNILQVPSPTVTCKGQVSDAYVLCLSSSEIMVMGSFIKKAR